MTLRGVLRFKVAVTELLWAGPLLLSRRAGVREGVRPRDGARHGPGWSRAGRYETARSARTRGEGDRCVRTSGRSRKNSFSHGGQRLLLLPLTPLAPCEKLLFLLKRQKLPSARRTRLPDYVESFASFSTAARSVSSFLQKQKRTCRAPSSGRL